jgi:hypothetical protein
MGLNNGWATMNTFVDSMSPSGSTNQPVGLVWGWMSLVGTTPLSAPPIDPNYKYQQVIILLSDGLNTQDRWYGDGYSVSTQVDGRMVDQNTGLGTCKNIKDAGITIYTVQVNTDGAATSALLQNCASPVDAYPAGPKFFLLTNANEVVTTFGQIATNLSQLHIAQ